MLMGRQLDDGAGQMLKTISEGQGIQIHTGVSITQIEGSGTVTGVRLSDGRVFPAQLVVISAGVGLILPWPQTQASPQTVRS